MRAEAEKEYYYLEGEIGRYDQICHGIKNWSITVGFALIAAAFVNDSPELFIVASLASIIFWKTEARWKRIQRMHGVRIRYLEKFLNKKFESEEYSGPRIAGNILDQFLTYGNKYHKRLIKMNSRELRIMFYANVQLPHNVITVTGVTLFLLSKLKILTI